MTRDSTPRAFPYECPPQLQEAPSDCQGDWGWQHEGTDIWASLPSDFATPLLPTPFPATAAPYWVAGSEAVATRLGWTLEQLQTPAAIAYLSGNPTPWDPPHEQRDNLAACDWPRATVYSGHQFGVWAGQLGDGRALCLGERRLQLPGHPPHSYEIQLKGAGKTPYSRGGDGRAVLRSSIREFLCAEAMAGLGIPTVRALSLIGGDFPVFRETTETAAVVARVAPSFIRFGHFEHYAARHQHRELEQLADFVISRHFPHLMSLDPGYPRYQAWLEQIIDDAAQLVAQWQSVGFCHGVLNTDNMSILGLTLDYGPFGFLDQFAWGHICNHSDTQGRYAYAAQPDIFYWNLYALGQALLPLFSTQQPQHAAQTQVQSILDTFPVRYRQAMQQRWWAKFGFLSATQALATAVKTDPQATERDRFIQRTLNDMESASSDFTLFFRTLSRLPAPHAPLALEQCVTLLAPYWANLTQLRAWLADYQHLRQASGQDWATQQTAMLRCNPKYILRNHLAELAIQAAHNRDFSEIARLLSVLRHPYDEQPEYAAYASAPPAWAQTLAVSCSS
ncbi:YdiU family protein [Parvibium lacunae]|uniref:Protein nucleotidyltransferase YdiU n=1 Tax=Parvibium lacunae TaxID=1888893 RepID=A0A368L8K5_9BURK|nr:YdiU family protein [Parvibium lacunae]